jgi:diguanylate cyclase (GGDEF)-like protein
MVSPGDAAMARALVQQSFLAHDDAAPAPPLQRELRVVRPDGARRLAMVSMVPLTTLDDVEPSGDVLLVLDDVTAQREAEATLTRQALYDGLTGLLNRAALLDRLDAALHRMRRSPGFLAVLFIDLDDFRHVNDSMGHPAGDRLLTQVADRLRSAVRPEDVVARLGGDEFVLVCEQLPVPDEAALLAGRVQHAMTPSFDVDDTVVFTTMSIGIVVTDDPDTTGEDLLRKADLAMYRAKEAGRDRAEFYHDVLERRAASVVATQRLLRESIDSGGMVLHYQPIVELADRATVEVEALVRLRGPAGELIAPDHFIGVAESSGLIVPLGRWVLERALRDAGSWRRAGQPAGVAVNVTPRQLRLPDFGGVVIDALAREHLHPSVLTLEVTEQAVLDDADLAFVTLRQLRSRGVHVAIDDFGTGYSSLRQLKNLPADTLKIDRTFVSGLGLDPEDSAIVAAVVRVARDLGMRVVAEGPRHPPHAWAATGQGTCSAARAPGERPNPRGPPPHPAGLRRPSLRAGGAGSVLAPAGEPVVGRAGTATSSAGDDPHDHLEHGHRRGDVEHALAKWPSVRG